MKKAKCISTFCCLMVLLLSANGCGLFAPTATAMPPTLTTAATNTPTITPTEAPTQDPYATWSTNFSNVNDPASAVITEQNEISHTSDARLSIDTANVNSGGKSIKDSGTIVNNQLNLITNFSIRGLISRNSIDLSDKKLSIEIYVPADSSIVLLQIILYSGNNSLVARYNVLPQKGRWYTYAADLQMDLAYDSWLLNDWEHPGISTHADAVYFLKNIQIVQINAITPATNGDTYFLIDKLGWQPSGALPAYNPSEDSLWKYAQAKNLLMGGLINRMDDSFEVPNFIQQFKLTTGMTNDYDWPWTEPLGDRFGADTIATQNKGWNNFYEQTDIQNIRYLVDNKFLPNWVRSKSYAEAKTILENYVRDRVGYYKGKTKIWGLFHEFLSGEANTGEYCEFNLINRNSPAPNLPFVNSPSDVSLIEDAFRVAREADPNALLFLSEYGEEMGQPRPDCLYKLAAKLVQDGTPIDGVGLESHLFIDKNGTIIQDDVQQGLKFQNTMTFNSKDGLVDVAKNVERYAALGLKVAFTEVDITIYTKDIDSTPAGQQRLAERLQLQAEVYRNLMHIALTHSNVAVFALWSWGDQYSWALTSPWWWNWDYGDAGIFDMNWQPKPAYYALLDELKNTSAPAATATPVTPTQSISTSSPTTAAPSNGIPLPGALNDIFSGLSVLYSDVFDPANKIPQGWYSSPPNALSITSDGKMKVQMASGYGGIFRFDKMIIKPKNGVFFTFNYTGNEQALTLGLDSIDASGNGFAANSSNYYSFGMELNGNDFNIHCTKSSGQTNLPLAGNLSPVENTWYDIAIGFDEGNQYVMQIWDPGNPDTQVSVHQSCATNATAYKFISWITPKRSLQIDDFSVFQFQSILK